MNEKMHSKYCISLRDITKIVEFHADDEVQYLQLMVIQHFY